jgi:hypothetical protein
MLAREVTGGLLSALREGMLQELPDKLLWPYSTVLSGVVHGLERLPGFDQGVV